MLPSTIARMMAESTHCWSTSEIAAAKMRMRTSGLSNCRREQSKRAQVRRVFNAVWADQPELRGGFLRGNDRRGPIPNAAVSAGGVFGSNRGYQDLHYSFTCSNAATLDAIADLPSFGKAKKPASCSMYEWSWDEIA